MILTILLSSLFSSAVLFVIYPFLKSFFLDVPVYRSSHTVPTPKGGGIVFALVSIVGYLMYGSKLFIICLPLSIIGFIDDRFNIKQGIRFIAQIIIAILLLKGSNLFFQILDLLKENIFLIPLFILISILGIVAFINFTNFFDGLDGLLCGCMTIAITVEAFLISPNLFLIVGTILAILPWNWAPAKLFMGDSGSTFLGAIYIGHALYATSLIQFIGLVLIVTPIWGDAITCIFRRYKNNQNIFASHKLHLYQRLNQSGLSHSKVSLIYILGTLFISLSLITLNTFYAFIASLIVVSIGIYLDKTIAKKFVLE